MVTTSVAKTINFEILNKISAKKTPLQISENASVVIHDMRIFPGICTKEKDSFDGDIYRVPIRIVLEQDSEEFIELYHGEVVSSSRYPQQPIEHGMYDILLVNCE